MARDNLFDDIATYFVLIHPSKKHMHVIVKKGEQINQSINQPINICPRNIIYIDVTSHRKCLLTGHEQSMKSMIGKSINQSIPNDAN